MQTFESFDQASRRSPTYPNPQNSHIPPISNTCAPLAPTRGIFTKNNPKMLAAGVNALTTEECGKNNEMLIFFYLFKRMGEFKFV